MARNLLAETQITYPFSHFPDGPGMAIHSEELRPVFEALPERDQAWVTEAVQKVDPRNSTDLYALAVSLGVQESVASGLIVLLHPDA